MPRFDSVTHFESKGTRAGQNRWGDGEAVFGGFKPHPSGFVVNLLRQCVLPEGERASLKASAASSLEGAE